MNKSNYETFESIDKVATRYYNDSGYCGVIGVAVVAGVGYGKAYHALRRAGRIHGKGVNKVQIVQALSELGYSVKRTFSYNGRQIKTMGRRLPSRHHLVFFKSHVAAVREGQVMDWTAGRAHKVKDVWTIHHYDTL